MGGVAGIARFVPAGQQFDVPVCVRGVAPQDIERSVPTMVVRVLEPLALGPVTAERPSSHDGRSGPHPHIVHRA